MTEQLKEQMQQTLIPDHSTDRAFLIDFRTRVVDNEEVSMDDQRRAVAILRADRSTARPDKKEKKPKKGESKPPVNANNLLDSL